jgi:hypothetical protein
MTGGNRVAEWSVLTRSTSWIPVADPGMAIAVNAG